MSNSDWSSFGKQKNLADSWRKFLNESKEVEMDEGVLDYLKNKVSGGRIGWEKELAALEKNDKIPFIRIDQYLSGVSSISDEIKNEILAAVLEGIKAGGYGESFGSGSDKLSENVPFKGVANQNVNRRTPAGVGSAAVRRGRATGPGSTPRSSIIDLKAIQIPDPEKAQVQKAINTALKDANIPFTVDTGAPAPSQAAAEPEAPAGSNQPAAELDPEAPAAAPEAAAAAPEAAKTASSDVSLSQLVRQDFTKGKPPRGVVKLGQQLKSFMDNREVSDVLAKNLVGKKVVTQLPPELQSLISIDQLRDFVVKNFPAASGDEVDALLQSVRGRKIVAEQLVRRLIVEETQRVLNEKK